MKKIENKTTQIQKGKNGEETLYCTYADLLKIVIDIPPQGGYNRTDIKMRDRLESVILNSNGELNFEDADFQYLKNLVLSMVWGTRHKDLMVFIDEIDELK